MKEQNQQHRRLQTLLNNASEVISIMDAQGKVLYESPSVEHILGYRAEEIIGSQGFSRLGKSSSGMVKQAFDQLLRDPKKEVSMEFLYNKKGGEQIWLETTGKNMINDSAVGGIVFNTRDISLKKQAEQSRRLSGEMRALSENSPDMIIRLCLNGKFCYMNPAVEKYLGLKREDIIHKSIQDVRLHPVLKDYLNTSFSNITHFAAESEKELSLHFAQRDYTFHIRAIPEFSEEQQLESILFVAHDISKQKQIEQEISNKNHKLTESINYAERIQSSILPDSNTVGQYFPDSFIFYRAKDVVSGDFPWFYKKGSIKYLAAVDCTGHGVPGALLSFIGYFLLNNITGSIGEKNAGGILTQLHEKVKKSLKQDEFGSSQDGMDIAFLKIDDLHHQVDFAGAHRPLYVLRKGELIEFKGDRKSIGGIAVGRKKPIQNFTNHSFKYQDGDKLFIFSDGFTDQFHGQHQAKYQTKRLKQKLTENAHKSMSEIETILKEDFENWKGDYKQIDDVLLIGITLKK